MKDRDKMDLVNTLLNTLVNTTLVLATRIDIESDQAGNNINNEVIQTTKAIHTLYNN